jgi:3-hydroxyisobutyrate dehydrogenase-like beta-hydroxyacid dehydrogenase
VRESASDERTAALLRVGYIGLGDIGRGMALNLAHTGFDLMVFDLCPEAMAPVLAAGAVAASCAAEIVDFADVIHICVVYDEQLVARHAVATR